MPVPATAIARTMVRRGLAAPATPPHRVARQLAALKAWGYGLAGQVRASAALAPDRVAVLDRERSLTYTQLRERGDAVAVLLRERGIGRTNRVGLLADNGTAGILGMVAASTLGADTVLLNPGAPADQVAAAVTAHGVDLVLHDADLSQLTAAVEVPAVDLAALIDAAPARPPRLTPPGRTAQAIMLTSGTTGRPKAAPRKPPAGLSGLVSIIERIPLRSHDEVLISAPLFHTWGYAALQVTFGVQGTVLLQRRYDPAAAHGLLVDHGAAAWVAVPIMLHRMVRWADTADPVEPARLRVIACSGSRLDPDLVGAVRSRFGEVLYNLYGSTEASWVTIATPADLRRDPATAGTPPLGTTVELLDDRGRPVADGEPGRFHVHNEMTFDGYLDGESPALRDGLLPTGDLGRRRDGLYFVDGRADQIVVVGGENVLPGELEDALRALDGVADAAAVGLPDAEYGQRLVAAVVLEAGADRDAESLRVEVAGRVARAARPREIRLAGELPRTTTGKVALPELRAMLGAPAG